MALQLALDELPGILSQTVTRLAPAIELVVGTARLGYGRLDLRDVEVRAHGETAPLLTAPRVVVRFSPWELSRGRIDEVRLAAPVISLPATPPALTTGGGESARGRESTWSIGRLVTAAGTFSMMPSGNLPGVAFDFALDLRELGLDPERAARIHRVSMRDVRLAPATGGSFLDVRSAGVAFSLADLLERERIEEVRLDAPRLSLSETLPSFAREGGAAPPAWTLGRLVARDGSLSMPAAGDRPGVDFGFAADLRELGLDPERAQLPHRLALRDVRVGLAGSDTTLTVAAVRAGFRIAGLLERRLDEVRLVTPLLSVGEHLPVLAESGHAGRAAPGWTIGRLATHDGRLQLAASENLPGVVGGFTFDLRELGTGTTEAGRPQHLRLHGVKVRPRHRPTWIVLDEARVDFTVDGLLDRRRLARVAIERGTLVLDSALRERLSGSGAPTARLSSAVWSVGVLDIGQLGVRLAELGPQIPDVTLEVHTRLRDVPLSPHGLARARTPQRIEVAGFTLYSPLDPFRKVVHIGSMFVEFTMAGVLEHQLTSLLVLSPTIYLGEDLIWYMNATRTTAGAGGPERPWTVRTVRADFGRLVVTFRGVDRVGLPLGFTTDATNVRLGDLAALRLGVALRVPKQSFDFPGLDLAFMDVDGELRFDYPPGNVTDNVVNTLRVSEIRWRHYSVRDGWLSATFDQRGLSGTLGGGAYSGYVNGGGNLPFSGGAVSGWVAATDLDLAPLGTAVAGKYLEMTGLANLRATADVLGDRLDRANGALDLDRPGVVSLPGLDALVDRLPPGAPAWQRELARIAVEALRDYPYTSGEGSLDFANSRGEAKLSLDGPRGARRIDIHYRQDAPDDASATATGASE